METHQLHISRHFFLCDAIFTVTQHVNEHCFECNRPNERKQKANANKEQFKNRDGGNIEAKHAYLNLIEQQ